MVRFKTVIFVYLVLGFAGKSRMNNRWLNCSEDYLGSSLLVNGAE